MFLFYSNQWRIWWTVVLKDEPVHDLWKVDETIMDGSVVIHLPDFLVRVSHHDDGRTFMEFRLSITKGGRDSCRWGSSQDEHEKDEIIRHIFLVLCSMPILWTSHLSSWTTYLDDIRLDFPYAISFFYWTEFWICFSLFVF